ncbi:ATP-binding protein [Streptomyces sp. NPDC085460]|uniref:ATP-binding protein n=1 Tax=Streptomyces sp. NPDC085460 TaxID=3365723 RepID=UPI0037D5771A
MGLDGRQQRLLRLARFPRPKRLEDFDFAKNPNVTPEVVADLKSPTWVREGRPLVLIGDSGTGKSHLDRDRHRDRRGRPVGPLHHHQRAGERARRG